MDDAPTSSTLGRNAEPPRIDQSGPGSASFLNSRSSGSHAQQPIADPTAQAAGPANAQQHPPIQGSLPAVNHPGTRPPPVPSNLQYRNPQPGPRPMQGGPKVQMPAPQPQSGHSMQKLNPRAPGVSQQPGLQTATYPNYNGQLYMPVNLARGPPAVLPSSAFNKQQSLPQPGLPVPSSLPPSALSHPTMESSQPQGILDSRATPAHQFRLPTSQAAAPLGFTSIPKMAVPSDLAQGASLSQQRGGIDLTLATLPQGWNLMPPEQREGQMLAATTLQAGTSPTGPGELGAPAILASPPEHGRPSSQKKGSKKMREMAAATRKHCNCKNSRCLKLYCECFASGRYCSECNCVSCCNNQENEIFRQAAVETILDRNPNAFRPKIQERDGAAMAVTPAWHNKGCNCKKSNCLKKYCECFQASIYCSENCKCSDCHNYNFALGPKRGGPIVRRPSSGVKEKGHSLPGRRHSRSGSLHRPSPVQTGDFAGLPNESPGIQAMAECMHEFEQKNGLQDLTTLLLSVAHEEAEKQGTESGRGMEKPAATAVQDQELDVASLKRDREEDLTSTAAPPGQEARVEAAVLRDFSKALSKLVGKVVRREAELEDAARHCGIESNSSVPAPSSHSPPPVAQAWRDGPGEWASPPLANGSVPVSHNSLASPQLAFSQGLAQTLHSSLSPAQPGVDRIMPPSQSGVQAVPRPGLPPKEIASPAPEPTEFTRPDAMGHLSSQHAGFPGSPPSNPGFMSLPSGPRPSLSTPVTPSQRQQATSVLASLLHQNRGDASNALSNRPSPIKQQPKDQPHKGSEANKEA